MTFSEGINFVCVAVLHGFDHFRVEVFLGFFLVSIKFEFVVLFALL